MFEKSAIYLEFMYLNGETHVWDGINWIRLDLYDSRRSSDLKILRNAYKGLMKETAGMTECKWVFQREVFRDVVSFFNSNGVKLSV